MAIFKPLDPELAWKAIEGFEDVLSPEAKALDAFYRQFTCPRCKGGLVKKFDSRHAFGPGNTDMTAHALLNCTTCGYLVEPHTNLVLDSGNPAKMPVSVSPIWTPGSR